MKYIKNAYFDGLPNEIKINNLFNLLLELKVGDNIVITEDYVEMITELKHYIDELIKQSKHEELSGLFNRMRLCYDNMVRTTEKNFLEKDKIKLTFIIDSKYKPLLDQYGYKTCLGIKIRFENNIPDDNIYITIAD